MAYSVLVGNMIGAKRIEESKSYVRMALITGIGWGIFCSLVMIVFKRQIISLFSKSE